MLCKNSKFLQMFSSA